MVVTKDTFQKLALLAASLPPVQGIAAEPPPASLTFSYHAYEEDSIQGNVDEFDRYTIDVFQGKAVIPLKNQQVLTIDSTVDSMSGASPWYSRPDSEGEPVVVSSPSPITDRRVDANVGWTDYGNSEPGQPQWINAAQIGISHEDDYFSTSLGVSQGYEFWGKNLKINYGADISFDEVSPEGVGGAPSIFESRTKRRWNMFTSLSMVVTKNTQVSAGVSLQTHSGYLSDPYKRVFDLSIGATGASVEEVRPTSRQSLAMSLDFRTYYPKSALAFQAGYRYFDDDWGVDAHTFDFGWVKEQGVYQWMWGVRYYSQQAALFYSPYFTTLNNVGIYSSDYRLSDFGAVSARVGLARRYERSRFQILVERYDSGSVFQLQPARFLNSDPGLVDYWRVSAELTIDF